MHETLSEKDLLDGIDGAGPQLALPRRSAATQRRHLPLTPISQDSGVRLIKAARYEESLYIQKYVVGITASPDPASRRSRPFMARLHGSAGPEPGIFGRDEVFDGGTRRPQGLDVHENSTWGCRTMVEHTKLQTCRQTRRKVISPIARRDRSCQHPQEQDY